MSEKNQLTNLFEDFENLSKTEWEEIIIKDLNGKEYKKILNWQSGEGFDILPFFVRDDIENNPFPSSEPGSPPFTRGRTSEPGWTVCERLYKHDPESGNRQIKKLIKQEAGSVLIKTEAYPDAGMLGGDLTGTQLQSQSDFDALFLDIDLKRLHPVFNSGVSTPAILAMYLNHLDKSDYDANSCKAHFCYDPFTWLAKHGSLPVEEQIINNTISELAGYRNYKTLSADGLFYHSSGATIVQEIGIILAIGSEFLQRATETGVAVPDAASSFHVRISAGSLLFPEIAKLRALRALWNKVVTAYDPDSNGSPLLIHSETSPRNKSALDPYNNMLRVTTEALSAVVGGADFITVNPFDAPFREPNDFSNRISRNVHHILRHEANLSKVTDPGAGSYYLENLTDKIAKQSWEFFQIIEKQGGIVKALEGRIVQDAIKDSHDKRQVSFDTQKKSMIGVNKYPRPDEELPKTFYRSEFTDSLHQTDFEMGDDTDNLIEALQSAFENDAALGDVISKLLNPQKQWFKPLEPARLSSTIEQLRAATKAFTKKEGRKPKAALLLAGDKKMRKARASFSQNFLGCGGYELEEFTVENDLNDTFNTILKNKPDIAVLCSSDAEYDSLVKPFCDAFSEAVPILILAGYPADKIEEYRSAGIHFFIHLKANLAETLQEIHKQLNIIH